MAAPGIPGERHCGRADVSARTIEHDVEALAADGASGLLRPILC